MSSHEALEMKRDQCSWRKGSGGKLVPFVSLIQRMRGPSLNICPSQRLLLQVIEETGYGKELEAEGDGRVPVLELRI